MFNVGGGGSMVNVTHIMVYDMEDLCYFCLGLGVGDGGVQMVNVTHMMVCDTGDLSPHTQA